MFDDDVASRGLGMELLSVGDGRAVVRMAVTASMVNGHAIAHGGYVFLLADTAFACACNSHGPVTVASLGDKPAVVVASLGDKPAVVVASLGDKPAVVVASLGDKPTVVVAAGADITFVRPAREGDVLTAHAEERTRFGRSGVYDVTVKRDDEVVAEFRGRSRVISDR
jgi:acyl-CoA thioesterase